MKRIITKVRATFIIVFFMFGELSYAQEGFHKVNVGVDLALPMGDLSNMSSIGFGVSGKAYYGLNQEMNITGSLGYLHFSAKDGWANISMIPVMFGFDYDFGGFYVEPKLGLVFASVKFEGFDDWFGVSSSYTATSTELGIGLGGGYRVNNLDFGLHFNIVNNLNYLGLRAAYNFDI